jgi:signal transduction histidine kinase
MEKGSAQAERARKIIQRVRDFLRKREPQLSPCELNEIVRDIVSMVELDADDRHVGVALDLKPSLPVVLADKVMIEQVILNLVKNAVEAMQEMPSDRRRLLIRSALSGPHSVEISVSDTGRGIPPEMIENLFTPFFTTKRDGMGMGLHICRSIVEFHDGRLWGTLNPGGGSTFRFTLPAEID